MAILDPSVPGTGVSRVRTIAAAAVALLTFVPLASMQAWTRAEAAAMLPATSGQAIKAIPEAVAEALDGGQLPNPNRNAEL